MGIERSAVVARVRNFAEGLRKQFLRELQLNLHFFGARISLSKDSTTLAVGSPLSVNTSKNGVRTGHAKIFMRDLDSVWNLVETIEGTDNLDHFRTSVTVSEFDHFRTSVAVSEFGK